MAGQATSIVRNAGVCQPSLAIFCTGLHRVVCAGLALLLVCCSNMYLQSGFAMLPIWTVCCVVLLMYISC